MKDKYGNKIYKGDVVLAQVPTRKYPNKSMVIGFTFTGIVQRVISVRTGYVTGGFVEVQYSFMNGMSLIETVRESKYIKKLSPEEAMLWKLENQ